MKGGGGWEKALVHFAVESTLSQSQEADFKTPAEVVEKTSTGRISLSYIFHRTSMLFHRISPGISVQCADMPNIHMLALLNICVTMI